MLKPTSMTGFKVSRGHIHKAPQEKNDVMAKLWHCISTKPENITNFKYYGKLHIHFSISLMLIVFKLSLKQNTMGT